MGSVPEPCVGTVHTSTGVSVSVTVSSAGLVLVRFGTVAVTFAPTTASRLAGYLVRAATAAVPEPPVEHDGYAVGGRS